MNKTADTLPKFQTDHMFIRTVAESKTQPCITFVETRSGVVINFMCARKSGYFETYGFLNPIIIQCDKEMSIIDVCRKVARERNARTVLRFAPKTNHQSNGFVEAIHGLFFWDSHDATRQIETIRYAGFVLKIRREPHSNICSELHVCHLCACLLNRCSRWSPIIKCERARDGSVVAWGRNMVCSRTDQFAENLLENKQWSRHETVEARRTKWNFDVEVDSGTPGPQVTSRPDEGMPTATAREEIPSFTRRAHARNSRTKSARKSTQDQSFLVRNRQNSWMPGM